MAKNKEVAKTTDETTDEAALPLGQKKFQKPITLAGITYTHVEMRLGTVTDLFAAENELAKNGLGTHTPLQFNGEMMLLQLVKVFNDQGSEFNGPFTKNMLLTWGISNYNVLRNQQLILEALGET